MSNFISVPTWKNGEWYTTDFETKEEFRDYILVLFKVTPLCCISVQRNGEGCLRDCITIRDSRGEVNKFPTKSHSLSALPLKVLPTLQ